MKKIILFGLSLVLLFTSCNKVTPTNPYKNCDVARYHLPYYDAFSPDYPVLFGKTYDASGNFQDIDCTFFNGDAPLNIRQYQLLVKYSNVKLYIIDKNNITDTVEKVILNAQGRPITAYVEGVLNLPSNNTPNTNKFIYKNNKLFSVEKNGIIDTCFYDSKGNIIKFNQNTYQYDYSKTAKAQFYIDDFMAFNNGFYLLQYLDFFPELTSPENVRTRIDNSVNHSDLINQQFDADGKLTGYQYSGSTNGLAVLDWNCDNEKSK